MLPQSYVVTWYATTSGLKDFSSFGSASQVGAAISPTTPPPPAAAIDANSTPPAFIAAPSAGAWASPMESPIHSNLCGFVALGRSAVVVGSVAGAASDPLPDP